jgi:flagellar basal-body rod protein FlgB
VEPIGRYDTTAILEKSLPILEESHRVLANNVANANTPRFSPTHVSFEESLNLALAGARDRSLTLETTNPRHIASPNKTPAGVVFEPDTFVQGRNDKSEFNIDKEMVELLRNSGRFDIFSVVLTQRYRQTREVLRMP